MTNNYIIKKSYSAWTHTVWIAYCQCVRQVTGYNDNSWPCQELDKVSTSAQKKKKKLLIGPLAQVHYVLSSCNFYIVHCTHRQKGSIVYWKNYVTWNKEIRILALHMPLSHLSYMNIYLTWVIYKAKVLDKIILGTYYFIIKICVCICLYVCLCIWMYACIFNWLFS